MSTRLRARLTGTAARRARLEPASLLGVEHEYTLRDANGPVDFRRLLHRLPVDGRRLDPGDPNAYRCTWGGALTCDGPEAEVASPPVPGVPGFTGLVDAWTRHARRELERLLPAGVEASGYSTHLSAALADRRADRVARRYARTYAPGLMLLVDRRESPGLLVRPRPGRVELGGEYVAGLWLRAATAYVAGSTRAAVAGHFPPRLSGRIEPAVERYGWYVDRRAFGEDLYAHGRGTRLRRVSRGHLFAQDQLEAGWELARDALRDVARPADLCDVDRLVAGDLPLPLETDEQMLDAPPVASLDDTTGRILEPRARPGYLVRAELATWDFVVFALQSAARTGYLCIPRNWLHEFFDELERGELDDDVRAFLAAPPTGRVLASTAQTSEPGFFDRVGPPSGLLPAERDPVTGRPGGGGAGPGGRRGKQRSERAPRPRPRWLVAAGAATVVVIIAIVIALALGSSGGSGKGSPAAGASSGRATANGAGSRPVGPNFRPFGTASVTIAYTQDGVYRITQAMTVTPTNVRPGDTVQVTTHTTSTGPNWVRTANGAYQLSCQEIPHANFSDSSTSTTFLVPSGGSGAAMVSGFSQGGTPAGSVRVDTLLAPGTFQSQPQGCTKTATSDETARLNVPPGIQPGTFTLLPTWGIFSEFPGEHDVLEYDNGAYPSITVVRTR
ncbi:MAG TPA: hypothetical protein VIB48_16125 [Acidimicrobiia bacterium]